MREFLIKKQSKEKGFTLVEVVLVMLVTSIVFLAVYALYSSTIKSDLESRYEVIASNLAQEGVEIMRNIRDEERMRNNEINEGFSSSPCRPYFSGDDARCDNIRVTEVEYTGTIYQNCNFSGCTPGQETPFSRECDFSCDETDGDGDCVRLTATCTVSWDSAINPDIQRDVEAVSVMTRWDR